MSRHPFILIAVSILLAGIQLQGQTCQPELHQHDVPKGTLDAEQLADAYISSIESYLGTDLETIDHEYNKQIKEYYTSRVERLSRLANRGHFYYNERLVSQIDSIGRLLIDANDIKNSDRIQWVINRTGNPNASCHGEGTIMLNLGLLTNMQNLDQIAFIMAHELGHYQLNHVNDKIQKNVEFINSDALQKKIKNAAKDKEMAREELLEMLDDNLISDSKHSRDHESETDVIGFEFYTKAGFPADQAVEAMKLLKNIDIGKYPTPDISAFFSDVDYEWKESWTKTKLSGLSLIKPTEAEIEKYRTHPDTDKRVEQLKSLGGKESEDNTDSEWCQEALTLDIEILKYSYWSGNRFGAYAQALQLHELNPDNQFVNSIAANCLVDFVIARKKHRFSKIVPPPNIKMKDSYFQLATFLDNINSSALKKLALMWADTNVDLDKQNDEAIDALQIKLDYIKEKDVSKSIEKFNRNWPDSNFLDQY